VDLNRSATAKPTASPALKNWLFWFDLIRYGLQALAVTQSLVTGSWQKGGARDRGTQHHQAPSAFSSDGLSRQRRARAWALDVTRGVSEAAPQRTSQACVCGGGVWLVLHIGPFALALCSTSTFCARGHDVLRASSVFRYPGPRLYPLTKSVDHQTPSVSCPATHI
jgi:hypothetical protein